MIPTNHPNTADCQMMIEGLAAVIGGIFDASLLLFPRFLIILTATLLLDFGNKVAIIILSSSSNLVTTTYYIVYYILYFIA